MGWGGKSVPGTLCVQMFGGGSDRGVGWGRLWRVPPASILIPGLWLSLSPSASFMA